ncbi:MAG: carbohydrate-binding protein [Hungatella sp.]|jgi:hypothetical protein|nr:carbohydrate-binding protein [Hungatella sp.]
MVGDWLLAAPVTERGQSCKWIYLPSGNWIEYNRGTSYVGGQYVPYSLDSESWSDLPLFIKEGAIIPSHEVQDYVGQKEINRIFVDMFPSSQTTEFQYYDDDGTSYDYENGEYLVQNLSSQKILDEVNITVSAQTGNYSNNVDYYYLAVHGQAAKQVTENSAQLPQYADLNALLAAGGEGWANSKDVYGEVTYVKTGARPKSSNSIVVSGTSVLSLDGQKYEAEYASLSGQTIQGQPHVDNNHSGFSGIGFVDNIETDQAALTFYSKVSNAGDYELTLRCSNGDGSDKSLSAYVNGTYGGPVAIPSTGSWDLWEDVEITLPLSAGNNSITFKYNQTDGDTGYANVDYMTVPFEPNVFTVEAEDSALYGAAKTNQNHWFYSGSGFVDSMVSQDAEVAFELYLPEAQTYTADFRFSNGTQSTKSLSLYVNDAYVKSIDFPSQGTNWNVWQTVSSSLALLQGKNKISLRYRAGDSGNINIDKMTVDTGTGNHYPVNLLDNGGFERPTSFNSNWTEWHPSGQDLAYGVDSGSGTNPPESPQERDKRAYFYNGASYQQSIHQGVSVDNGSYRVETYVKVMNTVPGTARMEVTDYGGNTIYVDMPQPGTGWHRIQADNVPVTSGYIDIGFYCSSPGGTTVHIDDVRLYKN